MVEVTQAARAAAAKWAKMQGRPHQAANMSRGACDGAPLVQAFASFEIAAAQAERAAVVEWLRGLGFAHESQNRAVGQMATAIEAGEHRTAAP